MKTEISFIREVSKSNNVLSAWLRYFADEMVPKREIDKRRIAGNSIHNVGFIILFITIILVHIHAGAIRKLMCGLFACTSDNPLS